MFISWRHSVEFESEEPRHGRLNIQPRKLAEVSRGLLNRKFPGPTKKVRAGKIPGESIPETMGEKPKVRASSPTPSLLASHNWVRVGKWEAEL